jgi:ornithine cyclodeaminase/alanine dehydrogenase-like protein (mu-crystallin family)
VLRMLLARAAQAKAQGRLVVAEVPLLFEVGWEGLMDEEEITLYKSVGIAYLDTAVAKSVYELAKDKGMGTEIVL